MDDSRLYTRRWRSALIRRALRRTARLIATSTACSDWTRRHASTIAPGLAAALVIPNGVTVEEFADLRPASRGHHVLAYGRLVHNKGFDLLLRAARDLPVDVRIGGDGVERANLERLASSNPRVQFLGPLSRGRLLKAMSDASVVVMPSRVEPFGIVALEAMASGRPVVASNIGGAGEFVEGGILVDPHDAGLLSGAISRALDDPSMGERGRVAAGKYDWTVITPMYQEIYRKVVG
jgi:glycosyltransferase involved in cell wall biosynthesis